MKGVIIMYKESEIERKGFEALCWFIVALGFVVAGLILYTGYKFLAFISSLIP